MSQDYVENDDDYTPYTPTPENDWWEAQRAIKAEQDHSRKRSMLSEYIRKHGEPTPQEKTWMGLSATAR